jgi:phosphatidylserine/phosphatidylglycerophosphate/cardiolipin synthase-like enzyme
VTPNKGLRGLLRNPWVDSFRTLVSIAESDLLLVSPFVKVQATDEVISTLQRRGMDRDVRVTLVTNLRPESILSAATDLEAVSRLETSLPRFELVHLPSLHAKVYIADNRVAVVTSANLTLPGIATNLEYGVALTDPSTVREVRRDFENYAHLGAKIEASDFEILLRESRELRDAFVKAERSIRSDARRALASRLEGVQVQLLKQRVKVRTAHSVFADTILYLLARGPLRTAEMHPLIKQLHPDLCDDSVDRVIAGTHFGKMWKHGVRTAQVFLRRKGLIRLDEGRWGLTPQT